MEKRMTKPCSPRAFLATKGINIPDGVLGGERRNLVFDSRAACPKFDFRQKTFKEKGALHVGTHTHVPTQ